MKLTFSTGVTVTVKPPKAAKALWLTARLMPFAALPAQMPEAVARPLYERMARLLAPFVECQPPEGVEKIEYLAYTALATVEDWGLLGKAVLINTPKRKKR